MCMRTVILSVTNKHYYILDCTHKLLLLLLLPLLKT